MSITIVPPKETKIQLPKSPIIEPPLIRFMSKFQRFEPRSRDSTAVTAHKFCDRKYFYQIVLGFREKETPEYFRFGSAYHKFREVAELQWQAGERDYGKIFAQGLVEALKSFGGPANNPNPQSKWSFLSEARLIESCRVSILDFKAEKQSGNIEILAVEQSFEVLLSDGVTRRGGKADQFVRWNGQLWGRDWKTTSQIDGSKNAVNWYARNNDPNDQFTGYIIGLTKLSGEYVYGLIVHVLANTKGTANKEPYGPHHHVYTTTRTKWQLDIWEEEHVLIEQQIQRNRETDRWPMRETQCKMCMFRSVCTQSSETAQMAQLEKEFVQKPWDYKHLED